MKKTFGSIAAILLLAGSFAFAEESTIIDFTLLQADSVADEDGNPTENGRTIMDFSVAAGSTFTEEQKALMKSSLALPNWEVELNSSARNVNSVSSSVVKAAPVNAEADVPFAGSEIMGVRIVFPAAAVNANAKIVPPFDIPAYEPLASVDENGNRMEPTDEEKASGKTLFEDGYGVVKNVGTIKALSVTTLGLNRPESLYVLLRDSDGVERRYYMGSLNFDGWRELTWNNPAYISEIRTREIRVYPIYPRGIPSVTFAGFQIVRDATQGGTTYNDFIGYFKDVKIIYDKAVLDTDRDISDEDLWGIIGDKEAARQSAEMSRFGEKQVNRYLEREKQAQETAFTSSLSTEEEGSAEGTDAAAADQQAAEPVEETQQDTGAAEAAPVEEAPAEPVTTEEVVQ